MKSKREEHISCITISDISWQFFFAFQYLKAEIVDICLSPEGSWVMSYKHNNRSENDSIMEFCRIFRDPLLEKQYRAGKGEDPLAQKMYNCYKEEKR